MAYHRAVRSVISATEAKAILDPYLRAISGCLYGAWKAWKEETRLPTIISPRSRANLVYDFVVTEARMALSGVEGLSLSEDRGFLLLNVEGLLLLRFKKLRSDLRSSGIPTGQQLKFAHQQLGLAGMPPMTNLVAGYLLNGLQTKILRATITCSVGSRIIWVLDLPEPGAARILPILPAADAPRAPRVQSTKRSEEPRRTGT